MARSLLDWFCAPTPKNQPTRHVRLQVEVLEDRLTPSWTGIPPATIVPSGALTVSLNNLGDAGGSAAITANEVDYYKFTAKTSGSYTLTATRTSGSLDSVIGLFNSSGSRLAYNDDISSSNRNSRMTVSLTGGHTYYLGVTNYTGSSGGNYTWLIDGPAVPTDDAYENNDSFSAPSNLGTLTSQKTINNLVMADGHDWYRFTTGRTGTSSNYVTINFTNSQGDLNLELYNSAGSRLARSNGVTNSETVSLNGLAAGTYYIHVYGYNGASNPNYSLTIAPPSTSSTPPPTSGSFHIQLNITGMTASQVTIFQQAAARWEQAIVGDVPDATYNGVAVDDIRIDARGVAIDGVNGVLGQAGPDALRSGSYLPIHGVMQFDTADLAALQSSGQLLSVIEHEMGHVLGYGTIWQYKGLLTGAGGSDPRFIGTQATAQYNSIFGVNQSGVPVENSGGSGTRDSHWRESVFGNELMTGYLNSGFNPLSRVTIASMGDLGYQVNLNAADSYSKPATSTALTSTSSSSSPALIGDEPSGRPDFGSQPGSPSPKSLDAFWSGVAGSMGSSFAPNNPLSTGPTPRSEEAHFSPTSFTQTEAPRDNPFRYSNLSGGKETASHEERLDVAGAFEDGDEVSNEIYC